MTKIELTQQLVKELFDYRDGFLYWKVSRNYKIKIGDLAGTENSTHKGIRRRIFFSPFPQKFVAARIIFLWHNGYLPKFVDHIDRNPANDKIENLREATPSQNAKNCTSAKNSSSKYLGVSFHKMTGKWQAKAGLNYKAKYLGLYINEVDAAKAYNKFAEENYGEFANLNIID